jgi:hypothetical protein
MQESAMHISGSEWQPDMDVTEQDISAQVVFADRFLHTQELT